MRRIYLGAFVVFMASSFLPAVCVAARPPAQQSGPATRSNTVGVTGGNTGGTTGGNVDGSVTGANVDPSYQDNVAVAGGTNSGGTGGVNTDGPGGVNVDTNPQAIRASGIPGRPNDLAEAIGPVKWPWYVFGGALVFGVTVLLIVMRIRARKTLQYHR